MHDAIIYTLATMLVGGLVTSYAVAFNLKPTKHILALTLFFLVIFIISSIITVNIWSVFVIGEVYLVPYRCIRGLLLFLSSGFLLYTTWKKN